MPVIQQLEGRKRRVGTPKLFLAIYRVGDQPGLHETLSEKKNYNFQNTVERLKKLTAGKRWIQTDFNVFQRGKVQCLDIETNVKGRKKTIIPLFKLETLLVNEENVSLMSNNHKQNKAPKSA